MGIPFSCCTKDKTNVIVLLLVGLDNAGKTVAVKGLAGESADSVVPTIGFTIINLKYSQYKVKIFDLGGGPSIRGIWHRYFVDAHGVIFVIDSSDLERIDEAKVVLEELLSNEKLAGKPVLLLANKQDNENALDDIEIVEKLDLESLVNSKQCPTLVESCTAMEPNKSKIDPGIKKGYDWLLNFIIRNYNEIDSRVKADVKEQEIIHKQELIEKIKRIELRQKASSDLYPQSERKTPKHMLSKDGNENGVAIADKMLDNMRPKSAVEHVKQQLLLNGYSKPIKNIAKNKTRPMNFYVKSPHSAEIQRKVYSEQRRYLKSAGDSIFVTNESLSLSSGTVKDVFQVDRFTESWLSHQRSVEETQMSSSANENKTDQRPDMTVIDIY